MVNRVDRGVALPQVVRQDGMIRVQANLTRSGIFKYLNPDGSTRREFRPPEEVFAKDSLATYSGRPLTVGHRLDAVDANTWQGVAVGDVRDDAHQAGSFVRATVQVNQADVIRRVDSKELVEVSCGYKCDLDPTPGSYQGQPYDAIQRNIRLNHVALLPVDHGRAGPDVRLLLDSNQDVLVECPSKDGMADNSQDTVQKDLEIERLKRELAESKGESAANKALAEQARADAKKAESDLPAKIQARVSLESEAKRVFPEVKCDGRSDEEIMRDVVAKLSPTLRVDGADALRGAFAALVGSWDGGRKEAEKAINQATQEVQKQDSKEQPSVIAVARQGNYDRAKQLFGMTDKKIAKLNLKLNRKAVSAQ